MRNAYNAFLAYVNRFQAFIGQSPKVAAVANDAPTYGEPDVVVDDAAQRTEIRVYAFIEAGIMCEMWGLPGNVAVSESGFARALDKAKAHGLPIVLRLNSGGGDVFAGVTIAALVRENKLAVIVDGNAASIASVIAAASPHVTMAPGATVMVHNPWSCVCGNAKTMRAEAEVLEKLRDAIMEIYTAKTREKYTRAQWAAALDGKDGADGTWFTSGECMEAGLCDSAPMPEQDRPTAELIEQRQMVATLHGVALPKNLAELPGRAEPQNPLPPALGPVTGEKIVPSVRVSHRSGAFYVPKATPTK